MAALAHRFGQSPDRPAVDHRRAGAKHSRVAPQTDRLDRIQVTAWALLRQQQTGVAGTPSLANGGTLGASQAGSAADLQFHPADRGDAPDHVRSRTARRRSCASAFASSRRAHPLVVHRRAPPAPRHRRRRAQRLRPVLRKRGLRSADAVALRAGRLSSGRGGRRHATASSMAALTLTRPGVQAFSAGFGVWGGAQPGVYRARCGPARQHQGTQQHEGPSRLAPAACRQCEARLGACIDAGRRFLAAKVGRRRALRLVLGAPMDIYLPIAGQSVNALVIIVLGFVRRRAVGHVRRRRRLPDHAAPDLLRNSADGRSRIRNDADHRRQRVRRDGPHAPRRAST